MRILGIDPGTATTGFGLIEQTPKGLVFVEAGVITTAPQLPMAERLVIIHAELAEIIHRYQPDQLAIELLFFAANTTTAFSVGQARGVIILAAGQAAIPISEYTPLQVKLAITGYGRADKLQVQKMVQQTLKLTDLPRPDDAADGLAIAITHAGGMKLSQPVANA